MTGPSPARKHGHATSFGAAAREYERARPGYPRRAVEWALPDTAAAVVDIGSGTGKLTRVLLDISSSRTALEVIAVEPLAGMREVFAAALPHTRLLEGTAERIPLPDRAVDAVVFGQAWHWVDPERASVEVARVLRPGGRLGVLANERDESIPWVAELSRVLDEMEAERPAVATAEPVMGKPFGRPETIQVRWSQAVDLPGLLDLIRSRSYVITLAERAREQLLGRVRELTATHPDLAGRDRFDLGYVTHSWRYDLPE